MKIEDLYKQYKRNYLLDTDTRKIRRGSIFFALKGEHFNGNTFAKEALDKGASYCVIDEDHYNNDDRMILVDDVLDTLQALANFHRKKLNIPIVSITGSNGKTTTKELILAVLKTQFHAQATQGNLNNHIGVPLTLLSFTNETEIGIVEMGANHQKEIELLSNIAAPDIGYITNFGKAHLEGFGGVQGVIKGKSELYTFLRKHHKKVLINPKDQKQVELTKGMSQISFNKNYKILETHPFVKLIFKNTVIQSQLIGKYNVSNILAAVNIGEHFNISISNIKKAVEQYTPSNNRSQIIETFSNKILLDAYNANPSSVMLALESFHQIIHPRKIVVLGDMFELGKEAKKEHQNIVNEVSKMNVYRAIFVGENFYQTSAAEKYSSLNDLKKQLKRNQIKESYLLIKGSRGMYLERILDLIG